MCTDSHEEPQLLTEDSIMVTINEIINKDHWFHYIVGGSYHWKILLISADSLKLNVRRGDIDYYDYFRLYSE